MTYIDLLDALLAVIVLIEGGLSVAWWRFPERRLEAVVFASALLICAALLLSARVVIHYLP